MHYAELRNYLTLSTDQDTVDIFDDAIDVIERYDIPDYMDLFDQVYGEASYLSDVEVVDGFKNTLSSILSTIISQHGIELKDDVLISEKIAISLGLYRLNDYEDRSSMLLILETEQSPQETLSELLSLVSEYAIEKILSLLESVSPFVISNLRNIIVTPETNKLEPVEETRQQIEDYSKFKNKFGQHILWSDKYFSHVEAIGLPYSVYMNIYVNEKQESFTELQLPLIAKDIVSIACLSEETVSKAKEIVQEYSDRIYSDLNLITKLDMAVTKTLMEFHRA